ncbi:hypothetical protein B0H67DRAFT_555920 [Lasiosphaeris hirsuta]|uniref:Tyrosinase copper-binding domain-containing protein n=1 Tax=Lasiosphaeris hirsuta TaxID=260670 RepID=A0AA40AA49_9PEZI|nr:hypothetical protein B0H67DRAFT_555920 [Lasiosphaeris hirsuta]
MRKVALLLSMLPLTAWAAPPVLPPFLRPDQQGASCRNKIQRVPWGHLTSAERSSYIRATVCLTRRPATHGIPEARTLWDELQYIHIYQSAYWDQVLDLPNLRGASVFDPRTGFGGDGVGPDLCVADGPFANLRLRFTEDLATTQSGYCLSRNMSECLFANTATANVLNCQRAGSFEEAWNCLEAKPHIAGHWGIGGTVSLTFSTIHLLSLLSYLTKLPCMSNPHTSPGDPLFFLHHTWIDLQWWRWQSQDPSTRLSQVGGVNVPSGNGGPPQGAGGGGGSPGAVPSPDGACLPPLGGAGGAALGHGEGGLVLNTVLTDYFDDGGAVTTLNHRLWSAGILPNATIGDVMDLGGSLVCAEYV